MGKRKMNIVYEAKNMKSHRSMCLFASKKEAELFCIKLNNERYGGEKVVYVYERNIFYSQPDFVGYNK